MGLNDFVLEVSFLLNFHQQKSLSGFVFYKKVHEFCIFVYFHSLRLDMKIKFSFNQRDLTFLNMLIIILCIFCLSNVQYPFFRGFSLEPKWALINTCLSCIARNRAMSCVTCSASGVGSTASWPVFTGSRGRPGPTRPGD
jgi:hypothetical protein